jgi:demethylmenaquinone methyltransferase / 2-methoxy-6-polyprenyl-1,4-benzoquinol methylase
VPGAGAAKVGRARAQPPHPNRFAQELFTGLPARYDLLAELLSLGQNRRWRQAVVDRVVPATPHRILDVATGTAGVALQLARRSPGRIVGLDLTEAMLRRGQENVVRDGAEEWIHLVAGRAEQLPFPDQAFDALTFTYLLRYVADPAATLRELARVVKPGAPVASLEFYVPPQAFWRFWWWLYTRALLPAAGRLLPGPEHLGALPALPAVVDGRCLGRSRVRRRRRPGHEPRRRPRHVGQEA